MRGATRPRKYCNFCGIVPQDPLNPTLYFTRRISSAPAFAGGGVMRSPLPERLTSSAEGGPVADATAAEPTRRDFIYVATGGGGRGRRRAGRVALHRPDESVRRGAGPGVDRSRSLTHPAGAAGRREMARPSAVRAPPHAQGDRRSPRPCPFRRCPIRSRATPTCADNAPATDANREIKPEWLILVGVCTHLGCTPHRIRRRLRRLALPLPRLAIRHGRPHPQRPRAAESGRAGLRLPVRHPRQGRLRSDNNVRPFDLRAQHRFQALARLRACRSCASCTTR